MKRKLFVASIALTLLAVGPVQAMVNFSPASLNTPGTERTLTLPVAADNSRVISLGTSVDPVSGKVVEGYALFHHKPGHDKGPGGGEPTPTPTPDPSPTPDPDGDASCYGFLGRSTRWNNVEDWVVNTSNLDGLSDSTVFDGLTRDIAKWEDAADGTVDGNVSVDILGNGSITSSVLVADTSSPDGINEVYFADISSSGAIGVTIVWGIFSGPPFARELVEWDQVYDDTDFDFGDATIDPTKMDFESIATHELGHSVGMDDLYEDRCFAETMYGYGSEGEIHARDLNIGDITGVSKLY